MNWDQVQGFYLASSLDGTSQSIVLTLLLLNGEHQDEVEDIISLFSVNRTVPPQTEFAVIGRTGKYENARGYAVLDSSWMTSTPQMESIPSSISTRVEFRMVVKMSYVLLSKYNFLASTFF
ncbi:dirigent protein 9-like [Abrus precatorius]|uniref:Dirigent protein n=1 Tax=Abrus precatorius TaxID=3816 RepID=A0A8B8MA48_ABRPR|nr:dirigent protein 9-like [Abrus precatorius]